MDVDLALGTALAAADPTPATPAQTNAAPKNQTNAPPKIDRRAMEEKTTCEANLKTIYEAVQAYQLDHKDLPNWLSDLVPQDLTDANVLVCPVCRRTGQIESDALADPKISTSYLYEFSPRSLLLGATNPPSWTRREWRRRQMGLVGPAVPLVRCRHHQPVLNLAFDGSTYESPVQWEMTVTNRVKLASLSANALFPKPWANGTNPANCGFPARDPKTPKDLVNLTSWDNARLSEPWLGKTAETLASLPKGLQTFAGTPFDVRGLIQLGSTTRGLDEFPARVPGPKVNSEMPATAFPACGRLRGREAGGRTDWHLLSPFCPLQYAAGDPQSVRRERAQLAVLHQ